MTSDRSIGDQFVAHLHKPGVTDPRPSQDEVEAMAAQMFGPDWKTSIQRKIAELEGVVAWRLDQARQVVIRERSAS